MYRSLIPISEKTWTYKQDWIYICVYREEGRRRMARLVKVNFRETVNVSMKMQCRRKFRSITRWMIFLPVLSRLRIQEERINLSPQQKMKTFLLPFRQVDFALLISFRDKWGELDPPTPFLSPNYNSTSKFLYIIALYSFFSFFISYRIYNYAKTEFVSFSWIYSSVSPAATTLPQRGVLKERDGLQNL